MTSETLFGKALVDGRLADATFGSGATGWHDIYKAAMLELEPAQLSRRIRQAKALMNQRTLGLAGSEDAAATAERMAIEDALSSLAALERCELQPYDGAASHHLFAIGA